MLATGFDLVAEDEAKESENLDISSPHHSESLVLGFQVNEVVVTKRSMRHGSLRKIDQHR